jgi:hypothetical protein
MAADSGPAIVGHVHTTFVAAIAAFLLVLPLLALLGWVTLTYADTHFGAAMKSIGF